MMSKRRLQMQKREPVDSKWTENPNAPDMLDLMRQLENARKMDAIERALTEAKTDNGTPMIKPEQDNRRINQYTCETCGGVITTIDRVPGTTPFSLVCRATPGCNGRSYSSMYRVQPGLTPTHEWYKPDKLPRDPGMRQHVQMGGLLIRPVEKLAGDKNK